MRFYLGAHHTGWLSHIEFPLFVSYRQLRKRVRLPRAVAPWALDSGGFSELNEFGRWTIEPERYAAAVQRYQAEIGRLGWAAIQDWMCEPFVLEKTGLSLPEHQRRTVASWNRLRELAPEVPWIPVLQGWHVDDYLRCIEVYEWEAGTDLREQPTVGVGSVCRRQGMEVATALMRTLHAEGIRTHGFGFKIQGLLACHEVMVSADSMAWSFDARYSPILLPECAAEGKHQKCNNCARWARLWRERLLARL
jgi:hypothetical protein